jgi:hypothetical protein
MSDKVLASITNSHTPGCILCAAHTEHLFNSNNDIIINIKILLTLKSTFDGMEEAYSASHTMALGR